MPGYNAQLILKFLTGNATENVGPVNRAADGLKLKWKRQKNLDTSVVEFLLNDSALAKKKAELTTYIERLPENSRIYLTGHGDHERDKMGGWKYDVVANLLKDCKLKAEQVGIISIVACQGALGPLTWNEDFTKFVDDALDNFTAKFHKELGTGENQIKCRVYGRVYNVQVITAEQHFSNPTGQFTTKYKGKEDAVLGRKVTRNITMYPILDEKGHPVLDEKGQKRQKAVVTNNPSLVSMPNYSSKQKDSKREYYWSGSNQVWRSVNYSEQSGAENVIEYSIPARS